MTCLSSFRAVHYRGIDGLHLPRLSAANLITGVNGVGKTALIEAIWLFMGRHHPKHLWNANVQRSGNPDVDPVARLSGGALELEGMERGTMHRVQWTFENFGDLVRYAKVVDEAGESAAQLPTVGRIVTSLDHQPAEGTRGLLPTPAGMVVVHQSHEVPSPRSNCVIEGTRFQLETPGEFLQRYSDMVRENRKQELLRAINLILPKVEGIEILTDTAGDSYLSGVTTDGRQLPLHDLGGGVVRLCRLLLNLSAARNGILVADEIENGIHHAALGEVWNSTRCWLGGWNVQLVATTHSAECIEAAMAAFADAPDELSIHKLFRNGATGRVEAATFTGETLEGARDLNLEVR